MKLKAFAPNYQATPEELNEFKKEYPNSKDEKNLEDGIIRVFTKTKTKYEKVDEEKVELPELPHRSTSYLQPIEFQSFTTGSQQTMMKLTSVSEVKALTPSVNEATVFKAEITPAINPKKIMFLKKEELLKELKKSPLNTAMYKAKKINTLQESLNLHVLEQAEEDSIYIKVAEDSTIDNASKKDTAEGSREGDLFKWKRAPKKAASKKKVGVKDIKLELNGKKLLDRQVQDNKVNEEESNVKGSEYEENEESSNEESVESSEEEESSLEGGEKDEIQEESQEESQGESQEESQGESQEESQEESLEEEENSEVSESYNEEITTVISAITSKRKVENKVEEINDFESADDSLDNLADIVESVKTAQILSALDLESIRSSESAEKSDIENSLLPYSVETCSKTTVSIRESVDQSNTEIDETNITLIKYLGSGGEGRVYLAQIVSLDEFIALKQFEIKTDQSGFKKTLKMLIKEVNLVKSLSHPNVIKYYSLRRSNNKKLLNTMEYNLLMEYMDGESLANFVKENKRRLPKSKIKDIMRQILSGLQYLHENNIIHRDLKPGNILTNKAFDTFKITDFGISTQVKENMTNVKRTCAGTPWYMAPEVILNDPYSYPADIWSLGCLCFELFSGQKPYASFGGMQAMFQMVNNKSPIEASSESIKKILCAIENVDILDFLKQCLITNPKDRPKASSLLKHHFLKNADTKKEIKKSNQKAFRVPLNDTKEEDKHNTLNEETKECPRKETNKQTRVKGNNNKEHKEMLQPEVISITISKICKEPTKENKPKIEEAKRLPKIIPTRFIPPKENGLQLIVTNSPVRQKKRK